MKLGSRYNQLVEYLKGLNYDKYIWKLNELVKDPKLRFLLNESFGGYLSDDKLKFSVIDIPVRKLVPCQNEIDVTKSLKYGLTKPESLAGYFKNPVVIKTPIITYNGNFIIDGHHRWSQVYCFNIDAKMTAWNYEGDFSAMQMLKIMQAAIASDLGEVPAHNVEGMNLLNADIEDVKNYIREVADPKFYSEYARCAKCSDDPEEVISIITNNCESMQSDNNCIKDAPNRGFMPQTDEAPSVLEDIKEGVVVMSDHKSKNFSRELDNIYYELSELTRVDSDEVIKKITESDFNKFEEKLKKIYEPGYVDCVIDKLFMDYSDVDKVRYLDNVGGSNIDRIYVSTGTDKSVIFDVIDEVKRYLKSKGVKVEIDDARTSSKSAPKVITSESNYYVDIDSDRIYVKIGENDADHEGAPYEEYTYYFDKKEWDPSVPELPERIKKLISNYIKDTDVFSDKNFSKRLAVINFDFDSKGNFPKFYNEFFELVAPFWDGRIGLGRGEYPEMYEIITEGRNPSNWNIYIREDELDEFMKKLEKVPNITINKADTFSDKSDDEKYREAYERYKDYDYSKRTFSHKWSDFNKFSEVLDQYLPDEGEGDTVATQISTAVCKLTYKWLNDGDVYDNTYYLQGWMNDLSSYANWLYKYLDPTTKRILDKIKHLSSKNDYTNLLYELNEHIVKIIHNYSDDPKIGSVYDCEGPFEWIEEDEDDDEDDMYSNKIELNNSYKELSPKSRSIAKTRVVTNPARKSFSSDQEMISKLRDLNRVDITLIPDEVAYEEFKEAMINDYDFDTVELVETIMMEDDLYDSQINKLVTKSGLATDRIVGCCDHFLEFMYDQGVIK